MTCLFSQLFTSCPFSCTELLVFIAVALSTWLIWVFMKTPANLPPGPYGLPFFGYLPFCTSKPHEQFYKLSRKYGSVFSVNIGSKLIVVLNSYEAVKEALVKHAENFSGRIYPEAQRVSAPTIFFAEGDVFKDYKRFILSTLRQFGFGKLSMEPRIHGEIQFLLNKLESLNGEPTDIGGLIHMSVSNVICSVMFGKRSEYDDPRFKEIIETLNAISRRAQPFSLQNYVPWLFKIPGMKKILGTTETIRDLSMKLSGVIKSIVEERSENHVEGAMGDLTDAWLEEAKKRGPENGKNFTNEHLKKVIESLLFAGTDTTSQTIRWGILYLITYPEIQVKVHQEIDDVIGRERLPTYTDREQMPYTEATLNEIHRLCTLVPLALPHSNIEATTLAGYHIPKRTIILPNLWAVHNDPNNYSDPSKFNPERFLDAQGKPKKSEELIPFSSGKRQCLGEPLARMELFLYFTTLFQRFQFKNPEGEKPTFDYVFSFASVPNPYKVSVLVRK